MICYLVRHGQDDDSVRGGWSTQPLTEEGRAQAARLADFIKRNNGTLKIKHIYSSDLERAKETAIPISEAIALPIEYLTEFRETNNGKLAGMKNDIAIKLYPGVFWNTLEWDEKYPDGESLKDFYERILNAWNDFSKKILNNGENVLLITHSGVINVILSTINGESYSNKNKPRKISHTEMLALEYISGYWKENNSL